MEGDSIQRGGHLEGDNIKRGDTWRETTLRGGHLRERNELTPDSYEKI